MAITVPQDFVRAFWSRVDRSRPFACWPFTGTPSAEYGAMTFPPLGRRILAHRIAFIITHGREPTGGNVRHGCHNKRCVRPDHLKEGTEIDNMGDTARLQMERPEEVLRDRRARRSVQITLTREATAALNALSFEDEAARSTIVETLLLNEYERRHGGRPSARYGLVQHPEGQTEAKTLGGHALGRGARGARVARRAAGREP